MKSIQSMNFQSIQSKLKSSLFESVMSGGLDSWSNYSGHDWSGWYCGPMRTRDSGILDQSNFDVALELLGGEVEGRVEVRSVGHWACGWFDQIMVKNDESNIESIRVLLEIKSSLEDYPVLDESDYFEREFDAACEYAEQTKEDIADSLLALIGLDDGSIFIESELDAELIKMREALRPDALELAYLLQIEYQIQHGEESALDSIRANDSDDSFDLLISRYQDTFKSFDLKYDQDSIFIQLIKPILED